MGTKLSKSLDSQEDKHQQNGKEEWPEGSSKTSTLPASFRRKANQLSKTGSLPRNSAGLDKSLDRNTTFGQRFRKSCRNWARQKGLVSSNKENGALGSEKSTKDEAESEESASPANAQENNKDSRVESDKEQDIGSIVASLVVEAHKKKMASRAQSRAQSREVLLENPATDTQPAGKEQDEVGEGGKGESCEKKEEESYATVTVTTEEKTEDHTTSGLEPQEIVENVGGEEPGLQQHVGKQSGEEEEEDNRSESEDDKLIVGGDDNTDNTDKSDSDREESQHENEDDRRDNEDIKCQENHMQNANEEESENPEEEAGEATAVLELHSDEQEGNEVNGLENTEAEPETSAEERKESATSELIDINGSDNEELCEAQTVSGSGEDSQESSDDSAPECHSSEKQVGEIIYDIVEQCVTSEAVESEAAADKLER